MEVDTAEKLLKEWNGLINHDSNHYYHNFHDLYRFLREWGTGQGSRARFDKLDSEIKARSQSPQEYERLFRYNDRVSRPIRHKVNQFWIRAKKIKSSAKPTFDNFSLK